MQTLRVVALALTLAAPFTVEAKFMRPVPAPVDRLIANIDRQLIGRPNDGDLNYRRGRLYALKSVQREVHIVGDPEMDFSVMSRNEEALAAPDTDGARAALKTSIAAYRAALKAKPNEALFHLSLAWALEAGSRVKLAGATAQDAQGEYRRAFELSRDEDGKRTEQPLRLMGLKDLVSYEAGEAYLRAAEAAKVDDAFSKAVRDHLARLKALPPSRAETPIVFSRGGAQTLADLETPAHCTTFDLDGTGRGECWSWISPQAGILVWDPTGKGDVQNGWQLFGSVSFFLFFHHGYEALAALDDDGDGWLSGRELPGIAVWTDANSDGIAQPAEVATVEALGIRRISTRGQRGRDGIWHQPRGLEFVDGSVRPSWDWVSTPRQSALKAGASR